MALTRPAASHPNARKPRRAPGRVGRALALGCLALAAAFAPMPVGAAGETDVAKRAQAIEVDLLGFPAKMLGELETLAATAQGSDPATRRFIDALRGQALVHAGRTEEAKQLAARLDDEGRASRDEARIAMALLVRCEIEMRAGDESRANALANEARSVAAGGNDDYVRFWAAMDVGITARMLGRSDEAASSLREADTLAEAMSSPYRRATALYWLSVLDVYLKQPQKALDEAHATFREGKLAGSVFAMVKAKAAESAALQLLNRPAEELAAMEEGVAIAHNAHSDVLESFALINLADIYLRSSDFRAAYDLSARSLVLAQQLDLPNLIATNKANMGFALFGLGEIADGKRLAEEAVAEYERAGASAEIASLLGEFGQYLASAGDYRGALALRERQQKVLDNIAVAIRQHDVQEMQKNFEAEKHIRMIELEHRQQQQRIWWLLAAVFATAFAIVTMLYRTVRRTNRLLAQKNAELAMQSSRDPLTTLYNRRHFQNFINEFAKHDERRREDVKRPVQALLLIDLDHFKSINDRYGHAVGDAVLIAVARRMRDALRETDMTVRWGGEEFLVFVSLTPADRLDDIVTRIMRAVSGAPVNVMGTDVQVTASIGYSPLALPPDGDTLDWERVLGLADKALYLAKGEGRNRAYGLARLRDAGEAALCAVESDFEGAWHEGRVELREIRGEPDWAVHAAYSADPLAEGKA